MYKCGWNGCEKAYGTLNHLNAHVTMQSHGQKRTPEGKLSIFFFVISIMTTGICVIFRDALRAHAVGIASMRGLGLFSLFSIALANCPVILVAELRYAG